ncbi:hypothetical protein M4D70_16390 [Brevibacillus borstelensis]|uniref:hypothetical protein n=1 Tax=Brevibacillus borstelensis TaxID=45462 RepID=UPI002041A9AB|nr:hypothetical protein [Brevibacillus borstelensis]MCM3623810.1 hypothetical protein [Brevibacillus borstelensis]
MSRKNKSENKEAVQLVMLVRFSFWELRGLPGMAFESDGLDSETRQLGTIFAEEHADNIADKFKHKDKQLHASHLIFSI